MRWVGLVALAALSSCDDVPLVEDEYEWTCICRYVWLEDERLAAGGILVTNPDPTPWTFCGTWDEAEEALDREHYEGCSCEQGALCGL